MIRKYGTATNKCGTTTTYSRYILLDLFIPDRFGGRDGEGLSALDEDLRDNLPVFVGGALHPGHAVKVDLAGGADVREVEVEVVALSLAVVFEAVRPLVHQAQVIAVRVLLATAI